MGGIETQLVCKCNVVAFAVLLQMLPGEGGREKSCEM
jgi:hypothetical protein